MSPHEYIQGCPLLFSDTAFFDETGKVTEVIKTDKDGFVITTKNEVKLNHSDIRRTFSHIVRERRKELSYE